MNKKSVKQILLGAIVVLFFAMFSVNIYAATYYVSASGSDSTNGQSVGAAFKTVTKLLSVIKSGDTGYIMNGAYNDVNGFIFKDKTLTSNVLIKAYTGAIPVITARIPAFYSPTNGVWTKVSTGLWSANYASAIEAKYWAGTYTNNNVSLFTHSSLSDLKNTANPEGIYFDNANDKLYLRLSNINANPNSISLTISNSPAITINNVKGSELKISGLSIDGGSEGVYITSSSYISLDNNVVKGGLKGIRVKNSKNIVLMNNKVFMIQGPGWTWLDDTKASLMETTGIWLENDFEGMDIHNNEVFGHFNGIMVYSTSKGKFKDLKVHHNNIHNIMDDGLEIEDYCNGGEFYENTITDAFVAISMAPVDASENKCVVHNNVLIASKKVKWEHDGTSYTGECYKLQDSLGIKNILLHHNTCVGRGIYTTYTHSQHNVDWTDNIFYSNLASDGRNIDKSGIASDGVYYNNNIYYRTGGLGIFKYWNTDSGSTEYKTLVTAKASSQWNKKWDTKSVQSDPLFTSLTASNVKPKSNSPACTMSTTGSYVGAIPC